MSLPGYSLRLARPDDLAGWHAACYPEQLAATARQRFEHILEMQESGRCYLVVAESETGVIIGAGRLVLYLHSAEIADLNIMAAYQGQGIGTALVAELVATARRIGLQGVEIGVTADNSRALALYQRLGFAEDRRFRLPGNQEAIILRLEWSEERREGSVRRET